MVLPVNPDYSRVRFEAKTRSAAGCANHRGAPQACASSSSSLIFPEDSDVELDLIDGSKVCARRSACARRPRSRAHAGDSPRAHTAVAQGVLDVVFSVVIGQTDYVLTVTAENGLVGKHLLRLVRRPLVSVVVVVAMAAPRLSAYLSPQVRSEAKATALSTVCMDDAQLTHPPASIVLSRQVPLLHASQ